MRKLFLFLCLLITTLNLSAQWYGDGLSASTAYYGVINSSNPIQTWNTANYSSGVIYVGRSTSGQNDLEVANGGTLTIQEGITVRFCTTVSDLRITGTGILNASGSSQNGITFTKNAQATWGHISFETMTTTNPENYPSVINNCLISDGDVSSTSLLPATPNQYGGAIHADFSYLTISNCEIQTNKAGWGGAIFVGDGKNPTILNCYIHNNTATTSGGGVYFWKNSYSLFSNGIVTYNSCTGSGGGGGIFIGGTARNVRIVNSLISHNTASSLSLGHNIKLFNNTNTPKPQFINSIIWYPANSIVGSSYDADFYYCAIQDPPRSTYTGCISLNAANEGTNPDGPFFESMSGSNWPPQFKSPCRDAGTTPSPTIPNDYAGNPRVGRYDIGAFEVQYNCWKTIASSTDWTTAANWDGGVPTSSSNVVIPTGAANYPTGSSSQNYTIGTGYQMIVEQGACVTLGTLTNNGTLKLYSTSAGTASLILNSYSKGGGATEEIQLFLTGGGTKTPLTYKWHYISSPVTSLAVSTFAPTYTLDLAQWVEPRPSTSLSQGWVAYDGYIYSTGLMGGPTFSTLDPGKGYDYYRSTDYTFTFGGQLNTGDVNVNLSYKSGNDNIWGYNLIGNPFPSGLDWDYIITHSFPANTTKSLYFTRNSVLCTYINGVGVPSDVTGIIPPMQGFFSKTYSTGNTIVLAAAARTHTNIHARYKGSQIIPLVRLTLTDDSLSDETVVRFDNEAKSYLDNDFDAKKMFLDPDLVSIYSSLAGTDYTINGLPFPETFVEIPVTINIVTDTTLHSISATQLQGLDEYRVELKDNVTGFTTNLKSTPVVTFSGAKGTIADRFILKISNIATSIENPVHTQNKFNIYPSGRLINIQTLSDEWDGKSGSVRVLDITGKTVSNLQNTEYLKNSLIQVEAPASKGIYMVELKSGLMRHVGKIIVR